MTKKALIDRIVQRTKDESVFGGKAAYTLATLRLVLNEELK